MKTNRTTAWIVILGLEMTFGQPARAAARETEVAVPSGTRIYIQLDRKVVSKKRRNPIGTTLEARVWRDVTVDGVVAIPEGTPVEAEITDVKSARAAGLPGRIGISARNLTLEDGRQIALDDGYSAKGASNVGGAVALALLVAWPLIFVPGQSVVLEEGTVLEVRTGSEFHTLGFPAPDEEGAGLDVAISYESIVGKRRLKKLPMQVTACGEIAARPVIEQVNGKPLKRPLRVKDRGRTSDGECTVMDVVAPKKLAKRFRWGINWFGMKLETAEGTLVQEIVYEREL